MSDMLKIISLLLCLGILIAIAGFVLYFFVGKAKPAESVKWGVNFSQKHAKNLGLDWKKTYVAILEDLKARRVKVGTYWDLIETSDGSYDFSDVDWQIEEANKWGAELMMAVGMKSPRWPECHIPDWAKNLSKAKQQEKILAFLKVFIERYEKKPEVKYWQVENEPFFPFGECPWKDDAFFEKEIKLVKSLSKKPIVVSDSGELSFWAQAAQQGDIVGATMYRKVWSSDFNSYIEMPLPPVFYARKAEAIKNIYGKDVICVELQAEPWGKLLLYDSPLSEQKKTMDLEQFKNVIAYAKETGLKEFYLWGAEWWFWMKEKQGQPEMWNEAKTLF